MSDVSAVVLSIGEPFTRRALDSVAGQTLPPAEIILVTDVAPFFHAMNQAAARVTTPFFVQVDADMVLDPECLAALRNEVGEDTGIAVGELRDPLLGQVVGVKLFRTECFRRVAFRDSITPDTDFGAEIGRLGWKTRYVGCGDPRTAGRSATLGDHLPDYTPAYTYRKHLIEGARLRYRGTRGGLRWRFGRLEESAHPLATLAQIALAHGFFLPTERDELKPHPEEPDAAQLLALLGSDQRCETIAARVFPLEQHRRVRDVYRRFALAGRALAIAGAGATVKATLTALGGAENNWRSLIAKIGLGHGILSPEPTATTHAADEQVLRTFLTLGIGRRVGWKQLLGAHAARLAKQVWLPQGTVQW